MRSVSVRSSASREVIVGRVAFWLSPSGALRLVVALGGIESLVSKPTLTVPGILLLRVLGRQVVHRIGDGLNR